MNRAVIVFLKFPETGKVKTRLAKDIGEQKALNLYKRWTEETLTRLKPFAGKAFDLFITFDPEDKEKEVRDWLPGPFHYIPQGPGDLGARLSRMANHAFSQGAPQVLLIGTDCPDMDPFTLRLAFSRLEKGGVVLGPAQDGGYYLAGLSHSSQVFIFEKIPWSTSRVLKRTQMRLKKARVPYSLLPVKQDIDTKKDLRIWEREKEKRKSWAGKISVVIPAFNEGRGMGSALRELVKKQRPDEVLVVDGGSKDKTGEIASKYAKVISSGRGRAVQMNEGAAQAKGGILLFLHADTHLPPLALEKIRRALKDRKTALPSPRLRQAGRFRMSFGHPHWLLRLTEFQTRFQFFSYGDQAFFIKCELFMEMGGFDPDASFEDVDFYRRLLKKEKPVILPESVTTSPRRYLQTGILQQKLINFILSTMGFLGFGTKAISHVQKTFYSDVRK